MAKIDPALRLSASEIDHLMSTIKTCRVATMGATGAINLTPMTFGWANGKVYIFGRGQKISNLRQSDTATVLVDVEGAWTQLKGIMMQGSAQVLEGPEQEHQDPDLKEAQMNLGIKHELVEQGKPVPYSATAAGKSRRWIVFTPHTTITWDNAKLKRSQ